MRKWYIYRTFYLFKITTTICKAAFSFCEDRKSFTAQNCNILWKGTVPIVFKQFMIEAELTGKYKV